MVGDGSFSAWQGLVSLFGLNILTSTEYITLTSSSLAPQNVGAVLEGLTCQSFVLQWCAQLKTIRFKTIVEIRPGESARHKKKLLGIMM